MTLEPPRPVRTLLVSTLWIVLWLVVLDVATRAVVHKIAQRHPDSGLVRYFEYGLSIESKLDSSMAQPPGSQDGLILHAGWVDPAQWTDRPTQPAPGSDKLLAVYGQSFAFNVTREAVRLNGHLTLRAIGGPAAPPDHSYAAYLADTGNSRADVVIFGILASSVSRMGAMSGVDWTFEHPAPFTDPRFRLDGDKLAVESPVLATEQQFRSAFMANSTDWTRFKQQLARNDRGFDAITFNRTWLDRSQIALLMRRGWVAHGQDYNQGIYDPLAGFNPEAEQIRVLKAMLTDLGRRTSARGQRLIVLLEQDQGYGDSLNRALGPTLTAVGIDYISTDKIFSANDSRNFQADGHYAPSANELFARKLLADVRGGLPSPR